MPQQRQNFFSRAMEMLMREAFARKSSERFMDRQVQQQGAIEERQLNLAELRDRLQAGREQARQEQGFLQTTAGNIFTGDIDPRMTAGIPGLGELSKRALPVYRGQQIAGAFGDVAGGDRPAAALGALEAAGHAFQRGPEMARPGAGVGEMITQRPMKTPSGMVAREVLAPQLQAARAGIELPAEIVINASESQLSQWASDTSGEVSPATASMAQAALNSRVQMGGLLPEQQKVLNDVLADVFNSPTIRQVMDLERNAGAVELLLSKTEGATELERFKNLTASDQVTLINAVTRMRDPGNRVTTGEFEVNREFMSVMQNFEIEAQRFLSGEIDAVSDNLIRDMFKQIRTIREVGRNQADAVMQGGRARAAAVNIPESRVNQFLSVESLLSPFPADAERMLQEAGVIQ